MASGQYTKALELAVASGVLWTSGTIRVLLVDSSYAYDPDHATVADVIADETAPQLTPTLATRLDAIERACGEIPLGSRAILARLLVTWRAEDYGAGRDQRALSQTMPAVKP